MAIKSDRWIRRMAQEHGMISPFNDRQVREGVISYGVSSYGYDLPDTICASPTNSRSLPT
jgi:dCTP deaminase